MNLINSVTSGFNFNFGGNFFNGGNVISNNYEYQDSDNSDFEEGEYDEENEEENEEDAELFNKKKNMFIMELDEFQYKHLKKYSALKEENCPICKHDLTEEINKVEIRDEEDNE